MSSTPFLIPNTYTHYRQPAPSRWPALMNTWLPVALFCCVFAIETQASFGTDHTSMPLHSFMRSIVGASADHNWTLTHHILRKIGHFFGYGGLSIACFRAFWLTLRKHMRGLNNPITRQACLHGLAIVATFLVASLDELHQSYLPNRTGNFGDVLLDSSGAATLQLVLFLTMQALVMWRRSAPVVETPILTLNLNLRRAA